MADEAALLSGGPADGLRISVSGRPKVLQVVQPCEVGGSVAGGPGEPGGPVAGSGADGAGAPAVRVQALYVYRRADDEPAAGDGAAPAAGESGGSGAGTTRPLRYSFDPASP